MLLFDLRLQRSPSLSVTRNLLRTSVRTVLLLYHSTVHGVKDAQRVLKRDWTARGRGL